MIALNHIEKSYGHFKALNDLTFEAPERAITLLTGSNGTGKSTALKVLAGILKEDAGDIGYDGHSPDRAERKRQFGYLPQGIAFQPKLTPLSLLRFYARIFRANPKFIEPALIRWGLLDHANKQSGKLSGGMRQRLGLAVLTLSNCPVMLLDEPGLSLDPQWRVEMQNWLKEMAQSGKTILVATHLLAEWNSRADQCLEFEAGRIARRLNPKSLITDLQNSPQRIAGMDSR